jgi:peptide-methionine (R)-S-oxide reductase
MNKTGLFAVALSLLAFGCDRSAVVAADKPPEKPAAKEAPDEKVGRVEKTNAEWKKVLTPQQYYVLREKGTERSGSGEYVNNHANGVYACAACGLELFASDTKFESGTGWPSYWKPIAASHVKEITDRDHGMVRTEVTCARCDGHLGHVFTDGPKPTGLRYCMNSVSLKFVPGEAAAAAAKDKK